MAEAMACGKPVIATGYSGNLEFMGERDGLLVPYRLVDVPESLVGACARGACGQSRMSRQPRA